MSPLLAIEDVSAGYGPAEVLFGVSLDLTEGEILALMGRNGMGKTTTIRVISGLLAPSTGRLRLAGVDVTGHPAHEIARAGVGLVPEGRRCFGPLTVLENLTVAARPGPWDLARIEALFPRLAERRGQLAASLSGGEQQMLAIGRALMTNPRLLLLDEATEGLAPVVRREIRSAIRTLAAETGMTILLVDQSLAELAEIVDRVAILEKGRLAWTGTPGALGPDIAARYLGV